MAKEIKKAEEEIKEWVCPRCYKRNSSNNEVCMGAEMGDGRCGHLKPTEEGK